MSAAEIDDEIIAPALWFVGELWERGEISVADEHIATEISIRVLALEREAQRIVGARGGLRVMLAAPEGEQHVVALRMIGSLLRVAGYHVVMVGADVPADALAVSARRHEPDVVCLTATMPGGEDQALIAIHEVQRQWPSVGLRPRRQRADLAVAVATGDRGVRARLRGGRGRRRRRQARRPELTRQPGVIVRRS